MFQSTIKIERENGSIYGEYTLFLNYRFIERDSVEKGTRTSLAASAILQNRNMVQAIRTKRFRRKPSSQFRKITLDCTNDRRRAYYYSFCS